MNPSIYINQSDFEQLIQRRIFEYAEGIASNMSGMRHHLISIWGSNSNTIKRLDSQFQLFGKGFWGYGVNYICNGKEKFSNYEISEVKGLNELNKHQKYNWLWVVIFKIEGDFFVYSTFGMDTCRASMNTTLLKKIPLANFQDVTIKIIGQRIFLEISLRDSDKPFSFEVDKYHYSENTPERIAKYYRDNILAKIPLQKANHISKEITEPDFNGAIEIIELELRRLVNQMLVQTESKEDFNQLIFDSNIHRRVSENIDKWVSKHPGTHKSDFRTFASCSQFLDLMDLFTIVGNKAAWSLFSDVFRNKDILQKHFGQIGELRNAIRHSRQIIELVEVEGRASIIWFKMALKLDLEKNGL